MDRNNQFDKTVVNSRRPNTNIKNKIVLAGIAIIVGAAGHEISSKLTRVEVPKVENIQQEVYMPTRMPYVPESSTSSIQVGSQVGIRADAEVYLNIYDATNRTHPVGGRIISDTAIRDIETDSVIETVDGIALSSTSGSIAYISRDSFFTSRYPYSAVGESEYSKLDDRGKLRLQEMYKEQIDYWMKQTTENLIDNGYDVTAVVTATGSYNFEDVRLLNNSEGRVMR